MTRSKNKGRRPQGVIGVESSCKIKRIPKPNRSREYYIGRLDVSTSNDDLISFLSDAGIKVM